MHRAEVIALAREGEDRVRPRLDVAVDGAGEVHAEEGELGVGHRVDEVPDEGPALLLQHVVLAAEGNDPDLGVDAHQRRDAVGVQPRAVDEVARCTAPLAVSSTRPSPSRRMALTPAPVLISAPRSRMMPAIVSATCP